MAQKIAWLLVSLAVLLTWAGDARAACTSSASPHGNTSGEKNYRVNSNSFTTNVTRFSAAEGVAAVVAAADTWNEQADGGYFRYRGFSTLTDIPDTKAACDAQGINYSLVTMINDGCSSIDGATTFARCIDPATGRGTQFVVKVNSRAFVNGSCVEQQWSVGSVNAGEWDLVSVVTHELGHTLKLGHSGGEWAVMKGGDISSLGGTLANRDLYEWDKKCVNEIAGRRSLSMYQRYVYWQGWWPDEFQVTTGVGVVWPAGGVVKLASGSWDWSNFWEAPVAPASCIFWHQLWTTTGFRCDADSTLLSSTGHRDVMFRENEARKYVTYAQSTETPAASQYARFSVAYDYSDDMFSSFTEGTLEYCVDSDCSSTPTLYTNKPISVAWDNFNLHSVTAWVNEDRQNESQNHELMLSFAASGGVLGATFDVGVKTSAAPSIACQAFEAGGFDCILVYVDESDSLYGVKLRRFWYASWASTIMWDTPVFDVGVATASGLTAFYSNGAFYVAVRSMGADQNIIMRKSADGGATWAVDGGFPTSYSVTAPTAVSYWTGNNMLFMVR